MSIKLKPGIMIALSTRLVGGVSYRRVDLERRPDGSLVRWETERTIDDVEEHNRAKKARGKARGLITGTCNHTVFGLLCNEADEARLDERIAEARALVAEHNALATSTRVDIAVLKGRIAASDEEAIAAITAEARVLLDDMERALKSADVKAIRDAASRARSVGAILDGEAAEAVSDAIKAARRIARQVVKRVEKGTEDAEKVLAEIGAEGTAAISTARFALLDEEDEGEDVSTDDALPGVDASRFSGLDLDDLTDPDDPRISVLPPIDLFTSVGGA